MHRILQILSVIFLCMALFHSEQNPENAPVDYFPFQMPDGYAMVDESEGSRSIVDSNGAAVGGLILTDLTQEELLGKNEIGVYLDSIDRTSEFFAWVGGTSLNPIKYVSHFIYDADSQERIEFYRVLFVRNSLVYDMWFDTQQISKDSISSFFYIAEKSD